MIDLYESDSKVYAENYSKIREFINRSDIQKGNDIDISYIISINLSFTYDNDFFQIKDKIYYYFCTINTRLNI